MQKEGIRLLSDTVHLALPHATMLDHRRRSYYDNGCVCTDDDDVPEASDIVVQGLRTKEAIASTRNERETSPRMSMSPKGRVLAKSTRVKHRRVGV